MKTIIGVLLIFIITGCGLSGGTHGSIKGYQYSVTKFELENAVMTVLQTTTNVYRDTIRNYWIDVTNGKNDTIDNNYYNDSITYLTIHIEKENNKFEYTCRYAGDSLSWANSLTSEIYIAYVYDDAGNGGSQGNDGWEKTSNAIQRKMTILFESEFINRIDKLLNKKHIEL